MNEIVLSSEQASIVSSAEGLVAIRGPTGDVIGWIWPKTNRRKPDECPFTPEEIAEAALETRSPGPWYTTKELLEHLESLDRSEP
jgi:hypothetical protein